MISVEPIGFVSSPRVASEDDNWGDVVSTIVLADGIASETLDGIETFSHLEIIFHFHKLSPESVCRTSRHPRDNSAWPKMGVFAHRGSSRPNRIGLSFVTLVRKEGRTLTVKGLDAIDGTPVLDIKPVFKQMLPREPISQPLWVTELMEKYY